MKLLEELTMNNIDIDKKTLKRKPIELGLLILTKLDKLNKLDKFEKKLNKAEEKINNIEEKINNVEEKLANIIMLLSPQKNWEYQKILNKKISFLALSTITQNRLKKANIHYVIDVVKMTKKELSRIRGCGPKTIYEIWEKLDNHKLTFDMIIPQSEPPTENDDETE